MPQPVEVEILNRLQSLVAELAAVIRADALEHFSAALGELSGSGSGRRRGASASSALPKGAKRDPGDLAALTERLATFIAKNAGLRIEQIAKELETTTRELNLPVKKLIASKRVSTKGQKRATTYFAGGGKAGPRRAPKASAPAKARRKTQPAKPDRSAKAAKKTGGRRAKSARPAAAAPGAAASNDSAATAATAE